MKHRLAVFAGILSVSSAVQSQPSLIVNLSKPFAPVSQRATGFLNGMKTSVPEDKFIVPLKPKTFRSSYGPVDGIRDNGAYYIYDRATKLGAVIQMVLGDGLGCPEQGPCPGDEDDWTLWRKVVENQVNYVKTSGRYHLFEIWNEPNLTEFWHRDRARYLQTWKLAYQWTKDILPDAQIIGPSPCGCDRPFITEFLTFAIANNVVPDILSWHEFGRPSEVAENVAWARKTMKEMGLKELPITINEYAVQAHMLKPGNAALYLANLERANVFSASRACWYEDAANTINNCSNASLNGLLTNKGKRPRSVWWVYKAYADQTGNLVEVTPTHELDAVASVDKAAGSAKVLIGRDADKRGEAIVEIKGLENLTGKPYVWVKAVSIPYSGLEPLIKPRLIFQKKASVRDGGVRVAIPKMGKWDAACLLISSP